MKLIILQIGGTEQVSILVLVLFIVLILFFVLRGLNLWYWKINQIIDNQNSIIDELKKLNGEKPSHEKKRPRKNGLFSMELVPEDQWLCTSCYHVNPNSENSCINCKHTKPDS